MDPTGLLIKLKNGDITNIVSSVKVALDGPGHSALAHRAIVRIGNFCNASAGRTEPVITDDDVALELALCCCQAILLDIREDVSVESNIRTVSSIHNILHRFLKKSNIISANKLLKCALPILEKILPLSSETYEQIMTQIVNTVRNFIRLGCDNILTDISQSSKDSSLLELWDLMLRVLLLVKSETAATIIFTELNAMSTRYECSQLSTNVNNMITFHKALVEKLANFYVKAKISNPIREKTVLDKVFNSLIPSLWQLLRVELKSGSVRTTHLMIKSISECVAILIPANSHHMECFLLISRVLDIFLFRIEDLLGENLFLKEIESFIEILRKHEKKGLSSAMKWVVFISGCAITYLDKNFSGITALKSFLSTKILYAMSEITKCVSKLLLLFDNSVSLTERGEDLVLAFHTLNLSAVLCVKYKNNKEEWIEVWPMLEGILKEILYIWNTASKEKRLKAKTLEKTIYENYYSVGSLLSKAENWEHSQRYLVPSMDYVLRTWETGNNMYLKKLLSIVSKLTVCFEKQGLKKEAQCVILVYVVMQIKDNAPQDPFLGQCWSSLQNEKQSKARTADEVLSEETSLIKSMCPSFHFNCEFKSNLLLWELSCYVFHRVNNTEVILEAWLALQGLNPPPIILLQGSALALRALFSIKDTKTWTNLISVNLPLLLTQVEPSEKSVALCSMAAHYQIKFLIMAQKHFDENESKVKEEFGMAFNPIRVKLPGEVVDPSDICAVQSSFQNLNINEEQKLMAILDSALNFWNESLEAGLNEAEYSLCPVVSLSGECLVETAFLYTLWGYEAGAARTWNICCKFARKMCQDDLLLQALSGLMNTVEVKSECISEAEDLLKHLGNNAKNSYTSKMYNTCKAYQALRTKAYSKGVEALKNVVDFVPTQSSVWCFTYAKLLHATYALLPKASVDLKGLSETDVVRVAYDGLRYSVQQVQNKRFSSSPQVFAAVASQSLSSSLWIGRFYLRSKMPREARSFLTAELKLALKLGLATRAAEFICELAFIDMLTEKVDEAGIQIIQIQNILGKSNNSVHDEVEVPKTELAVVGQLNTENNVNNAASPCLQKRPLFDLPFGKHGSSCKCYTCSNVSVQNIWLMYNHLQAKASVLKFYAHDAMQIFRNTLRAALSVLQKLQQESSLPGSLLLQHQLACTVICLRLDLVDMLAMYEKDNEAYKKNKATLSLIQDLKTHENQLLAEALDQKMCIVNIIEKRDGKTTGSKTSQASLPISPIDILVKTPEMKTPIGTEKKRHPLKALKSSNQLLVPKTDQQFFTPKVRMNIGCVFKSAHNDENSVTSRKIFKTRKPNVDEPLLDLEDSVDVFNIKHNSDNPHYAEGIKGSVTSRISKIPHHKSIKSSKSKTDVKPNDISKISTKSSIDDVSNISSDVTSVSQKSGRTRNVSTFGFNHPRQVALRPHQPTSSTSTTLKRSEEEVNLDAVESNKSKKSAPSKSIVEKEVSSNKVGSSTSRKQMSSKTFSADTGVASESVEGTRSSKQRSSKSIPAEKKGTACANIVGSLKSKNQIPSQSVSCETTRTTRQRKN